MVLTKAELVASLQREALILLHLAGKVDSANTGYRPTAKQRSTLELLRYLSMMGPALISAAKAGAFDPAAWTAEQKVAEARDFEQTVAAIATLKDQYPALLADITDADLRGEITMFGNKSSRGAFFVNTVLGSHAAYRTQLFCYLKACGREELSTLNLWAGVDAPTPS